LNSDLDLTIHPDFKRGIDRWVLVHVSDDGREYYELDMDEPLTLESVTEEDDSEE